MARHEIHIGLIGDYDAAVVAHRAIPEALRLSATQLQLNVQHQWLPTAQLLDVDRLKHVDGIWCVPGTPYRNMAGALLAIQHARNQYIPFLGTCGGFQHAIIEYARNVLGWADADHAESSPDAMRPVITALECALVETIAPIRLLQGSRLRAAYQQDEICEGYRCRYGIHPGYQQELLHGSLRASALDVDGAVHAVELDTHPFFVGVLFQPERVALEGCTSPLVSAFLSACAA